MPPRKTPTKPAEAPLPPAWVDDDDSVIEPQTIAAAEEATLFEGDVIEPDEPIRAVAVTGPTSNSVIVGLGALASMSDEDFEAKKLVMSRGLARVVDIQQSLMIDKQDYGRVPGISKPFLQLPGAEKLANFYGYAVRQEVERVIGKRAVTELEGVRGEFGEWLSPPLAYHVKSFVHLGSFDGPIVAQGFGEANSWEDKYRWRWEYPKCEKCGHELMKGKPDSAMAGKYYCPGFKGGCWAKYELSQVKPPAKVENNEPYGLAETLIQIAGKRSFVASIRRATGTSGLFSQDDDSPSVQQQAAASDTSDAPTVEAAPIGIQVSVGAKTTEATQLQHTELKRLAMEKGLNGAKIADLLARLFSMDVEPTGKAASDAVKTLNAEQMGALLRCISTGELLEETAEADAADALARANPSVSDTAQAIASGQPLGG